MSEIKLAMTAWSSFKKHGMDEASLLEDISWRLETASGACGALANTIYESNVKRHSDEASNNVGHFLTIMERELHLLKVLLEEGLQNKLQEETA